MVKQKHTQFDALLEKLLQENCSVANSTMAGDFVDKHHHERRASTSKLYLAGSTKPNLRMAVSCETSLDKKDQLKRKTEPLTS